MKTEMRWYKFKHPYSDDEGTTILQYRTFNSDLYMRRLSQTVGEANEACWSEWEDVPTVVKEEED